MLDAVDKAYKTYNEGRLAFRQYFATCGPNASRGSTGSSLSCAATSCLTQACAGSAPDRRI